MQARKKRKDYGVRHRDGSLCTQKQPEIVQASCLLMHGSQKTGVCAPAAHLERQGKPLPCYIALCAPDQHSRWDAVGERK